MQNDILIVVGGGILQVPCVKEALLMGLRTLVIDGDSNAPAFEISSFSLIVSTKDTKIIIEKLMKHPLKSSFKGVMTAGTDASHSVSLIAKALELQGLSEKTTERCTNKLLMRQTLKEAHIPVPDFYLATTSQEAAETFLKIKSGKAVMKPLDNMGARGVVKVSSEKEAQKAFDVSCEYSQSGHVLIEEFLEGEELSIDSLIFNDHFVVCGVGDRLIEREPYFIEIGHNLPSSKSPDVIKDACDMLYKGAKALGIDRGTAKGDIKITPSGARIVEIAARLSGGFMSSYTFPYSSGVNLNRAAILLAIGENPPLESLEPTKHFYSVERAIFAPLKGVFIKANVPPQVFDIPFINNVFITKNPGDSLLEVTSNVDKIGNIIASAPTLIQAEDAVKKALSLIKIEMREYKSA
jgi:biotin carboxylase